MYYAPSEAKWGIAMRVRGLGISGVVIGLGAMLIAIRWWAGFYREVANFIGDGNLRPYVECLYTFGGPCRTVAQVAGFFGASSYEPALFWMGGTLTLLGVGCFTMSAPQREASSAVRRERTSSRIDPVFDGAPNKAGAVHTRIDEPVARKAVLECDHRTEYWRGLAQSTFVLLVVASTALTLAHDDLPETIAPWLRSLLSRESNLAPPSPPSTSANALRTGQVPAGSPPIARRPPETAAPPAYQPTPPNSSPAPLAARPGQPKLDIGGLYPGISSRDAISIAGAAEFSCSWTADLSYIDCQRGTSEFGDQNWRQFRLFSAVGVVSGIEYRFKTGNDYRSVIKVISDTYGIPTNSDGSSNRASWRLDNGSNLEYRQLGDSGVMTLVNSQVRARLQAEAEAARRNSYPQPRF